MPRQRTSPIWKMSSDEFRELVVGSPSYRVILDTFGLRNRGGNHRTLKKRIAEEGLSTDHLQARHDVVANLQRFKRMSLEEILVRDSDYQSTKLKNRLLEEGLIENECSLCDVKDTWQGKPLVLILDHINGDHRDNRRENLRLVCPNCNSQLPTHAGRKNKKPDRLCRSCGVKIWRYNKSGLCIKCVKHR